MPRLAILMLVPLLAAGCVSPPSFLEDVAQPGLPAEAYEFVGGILDENVWRTGEPSLAIGTDGVVYVCAPAGAQGDSGEDTNLNFIWRSDDGGNTFVRLPTTGREMAHGGGDCDIALDAAGSVYEIGLLSGAPYPVPMAITFTASHDKGETWTSTQMVSNAPVNDRQWIATHDDAIYVTWQQVDTGIWVAKSTDKGRTFPQQTLAMPRYANSDLQRYFIEGPIRVSPVDGTVYVPDGSMNGLDFWGAPNPVESEERGNVAVSVDGGLTWTVKPAGDVPTGWAFNVDRAGTLWTSTTRCDADDEGNLTGCTPLVWYSTDKATSWEGPFEVSVPPALRIAHLWLATGSAGEVGLAFYATETLNWPEGNETEGDWHVWFAGAHDAAAGDGATWSTQRVLDEPIHRGVLGRDLVDYLSVVIHPVTGLPHIAYTSTVGKEPDAGPYGRIGEAHATGGEPFLTQNDRDAPVQPAKNRGNLVERVRATQ